MDAAVTQQPVPPAQHKKHLASERDHALMQRRFLSPSTDPKQVLDAERAYSFQQPRVPR